MHSKKIQKTSSSDGYNNYNNNGQEIQEKFCGIDIHCILAL